MKNIRTLSLALGLALVCATAAHAQVVLEVPAASCTSAAAEAASLPAGTYSCRSTTSVTVAAAAAPNPSTSTSSSTSASVAPLPLLAPGSGGRIEAPGDSDSGSFGTKTISGTVPPLSNLQIVYRGGIARFGPATVDGLSVIRHQIRQGDPLRNGGNRSELSYGSFNFANGEDVWFAAAYRFDADFEPAKSGGANDRLLIQQTHQDNTSPAPIGNPFSLTYVGGGSSQGLNWIVTYQGNDYELYRTPIVTGQWMRLITHYRSGFASRGDGPLMEAWVAYGAGAYKKLPPAGPWLATQQFGDLLSTKGSGNDWPKIGLYKWTTGSWGSSSTRTMYSSGLYAGKGADLLASAQEALKPFAR